MSASDAPAHVVDLDDVICDCAGPLMARLAEATGRHVAREEFRDYHRLPELYGLDREAFLRIIGEDTDWIADPDPLPGAAEALDRLADAGHRVFIVTARGYLNDAEALTADWLARHGMAHDRLIIVPSGVSKSQAYSGQADAFSTPVDDSPYNLEDARQSGQVRATVCIDQPWNENYRDPVEGYRYASLFAAVNDLIRPLPQTAGYR